MTREAGTATRRGINALWVMLAALLVLDSGFWPLHAQGAIPAIARDSGAGRPAADCCAGGAFDLYIAR